MQDLWFDSPHVLIGGRWQVAAGGEALPGEDPSTERKVGAIPRGGQLFVNDYGAGGGAELPFGAVGKSGHGREKGFEALHGFSVLKTIAARHG